MTKSIKTKKNDSVRKKLRNLRRVASILKQARRIHKTGSFEKEANQIEALAKKIQQTLKKETSAEEVLKYYDLK